jgi:RsiW-degrading membrane proteinase PrsW (M82 family)
MLLLFVSLFPIIVILFYVYSKDKFQKEPILLLLYAFLLGAFIVIPILVVETSFATRFVGTNWFDTAFINAFLIAALSEEFFKFVVLYYFLWKKKEFNQKYDGIIYAVFISMGFASIENLMYGFQDGMSTALARVITAVPAHALFAISMGYYFGLAKFNKPKRNKFFLLSLLIPIILHGIYDFLLMTGKEVFLYIFFIFLIGMYVYGFKKVRSISQKSRLNPFQDGRK